MSKENSMINEFMNSEFAKKNLEGMKKQAQYPSGAEGLPEEAKGADVPDLKYKGTEKGADEHFESLSEAHATHLEVAEKDPKGDNDDGLKAAGDDKTPAKEAAKKDEKKDKKVCKKCKKEKCKCPAKKKADALTVLQKVADLVDEKALEKFESGEEKEAAELMDLANEIDEIIKSEVSETTEEAPVEETTEEKTVEAKREAPKCKKCKKMYVGKDKCKCKKK